MPVTGVHALFYSPEAEKVRAVLRDVMGWPSVDAGGGWLIFGLPPAELGVHPSDGPHHEIALMCNDIGATAAELRAKGVHIRGEPEDRGFGSVVTMVLPGDLEVLLYEPHHPTAV
jgi:hypothetical protein